MCQEQLKLKMSLVLQLYENESRYGMNWNLELVMALYIRAVTTSEKENMGHIKLWSTSNVSVFTITNITVKKFF